MTTATAIKVENEIPQEVTILKPKKALLTKEEKEERKQERKVKELEDNLN